MLIIKCRKCGLEVEVSDEYRHLRGRICIDCHRKDWREWKRNHRTELGIKNKERYRMNLEENRKKGRERVRKQRHELRLEILSLLGNKCVRCEIDDFRVLQIDHCNGGGNKEKRDLKYDSSSYNYYCFIKREILNGSKNYQLLCANCNWIKKYERCEKATVI